MAGFAASLPPSVLTLAAYEAVSRSYARLVQERAPLAPHHVAGAGAAARAPFDTHLAIFFQQHSKHVRRSAWRHREEAALAAYERRWRAGEHIAAIAGSRAVNFPPFLLARLLLPRLGVPAELARDPQRIADARLRAEVAECAAADAVGAPAVDRLRASVGEEHEFRLQRLLAALAGGARAHARRARAVEFDTEVDLRRLGYKKTPDARLRRPIVVACPFAGGDHAPCTGAGAGAGAGAGTGPPCRGQHVVCWIDSKAVFGDPFTHDSNSAQFSAYCDMFGPGLALYWFGFVDALASCSAAAAPGQRETRLLLAVDLPEQWRPVTDAEWAALRASLPPPPAADDVGEEKGHKRDGDGDEVGYDEEMLDAAPRPEQALAASDGPAPQAANFGGGLGGGALQPAATARPLNAPVRRFESSLGSCMAVAMRR